MKMNKIFIGIALVFIFALLPNSQATTLTSEEFFGVTGILRQSGTTLGSTEDSPGQIGIYTYSSGNVRGALLLNFTNYSNCVFNTAHIYFTQENKYQQITARFYFSLNQTLEPATYWDVQPCGNTLGSINNNCNQSAFMEITTGSHNNGDTFEPDTYNGNLSELINRAIQYNGGIISFTMANIDNEGASEKGFNLYGSRRYDSGNVRPYVTAGFSCAVLSQPNPTLNITINTQNNSIQKNPLVVNFTATDGLSNLLKCNLTTSAYIQAPVLKTILSANYSDGGSAGINVQNYSGAFQTFIPIKGGFLLNVSLYMVATGTPLQNSTRLYLFNATGTLPDKQIGFIGNVPASYKNTSVYNWVNISTQINYNLTWGKTYAWVLDSANSNGNHFRIRQNDSGNPYSDGNAGTTTGYNESGFVATTGKDNLFMVWVSNESSQQVQGTYLAQSGNFHQNETSYLNFTSSIDKLNNNYTISCIDLNNSITNSTFDNFTSDLYAPVIYQFNPQPSQIINRNLENMTLNSSCSDNIGLASFSAIFYNSSYNEFFINSTNEDSANIKKFFDLNNYASGNYNIDFSCTDTAGYLSSSSNSITFINLLPHNLNLVSPANNTVINSNNIDLKYSENTISNCTLFLNGTASENQTSDIGINTITLAGLQNQTTEWQIFCYNSMLNATSQSWIFNIAHADVPAVAPPEYAPSLACPLDNAIQISIFFMLFGIAFGLMIFAKFIKHGIAGAFGSLILMFASLYTFMCFPAISLILIAASVIIGFYFVSQGMQGQL